MKSRSELTSRFAMPCIDVKADMPRQACPVQHVILIGTCDVDGAFDHAHS